jgi:hypothetical protein
MGEMRNAYMTLKGRENFRDLGVDGRIIKRWILKK